MELTTIALIVFAALVFGAMLVSVFVNDRSGALDDEKATPGPRRGKRGAHFDDAHRDHD